MTAKKTVRPARKTAKPAVAPSTTFEQRAAPLPSLQARPSAPAANPAEDAPAAPAFEPLSDKDVILRLVEMLKNL